MLMYKIIQIHSFYSIQSNLWLQRNDLQSDNFNVECVVFVYKLITFDRNKNTKIKQNKNNSIQKSIVLVHILKFVYLYLAINLICC